MSGPNWRPSEDTLELLEELREALKHWENKLEEEERFKGENLGIKENERKIKDKIINLKFMQYMVRRNAYP